MKAFLKKIAMDTNDKLDLKIMLFCIPVAYFSFLFHESGHWLAGELLGNKMAFNLNFAWPASGHYIHASDDLYVSMGGPVFTILLSALFLLVIERYKTIYAYTVVIFQFANRLFSLVFGGFSRQDEARISELLATGTYAIAALVLAVLLLMVWRGSVVLKLNYKSNWYLFTVCILCQVLVIATYSIF